MREKVFQNQDWKFKTGAILTVFFSAVCGFLHIGVIYLFGMPLIGLIIGLIFIWSAREKIKSKIIWTFLPIPIMLVFFWLFIQSIPKAEPETFLIPQDFRGRIAVIFNEDCGQTLRYENGRRIYDFSASEILITNATETEGLLDRKFYLVDEAGKKSELPEFSWTEFKDEQKNLGWIFSKTTLTKDLVGVFSTYRNYFSYIIADYRSIKNENNRIKEEKNRLFETKMNASLKECRR